MTKRERILNALSDGNELTAKQIAARFNVGDPTREVNRLRAEGFAVYLNNRTNAKGEVTRKYRLGTPTRAVVAAGYQALSQS